MSESLLYIFKYPSVYQVSSPITLWIVRKNQATCLGRLIFWTDSWQVLFTGPGQCRHNLSRQLAVHRRQSTACDE